MKQTCSAVALLAALASCQAFVGPSATLFSSKNNVIAPNTRAAATAAAVARLQMSSVQSAAPVDGEASSEYQKRFGALDGKDVKTVSESIVAFCNAYPKPIIPQYRTIMNDLIQSTHLTVVNAYFQYDAVFALGLRGIFLKLMKSYPGPGEAEKVFKALTVALDLDIDRVISDAESLESWARSADLASVEEALSGKGDSKLAEITNAKRGDKFYNYSKLWGMGLIQVMEAASIEVTEHNVDKFIGLAGFGDTKVKAQQDLIQYREVLDRMSQAEQLFKEIEIREKKKMADRLEEKAKRALAAAEKAEQESAAAPAAAAAN